VCGDAVHTRVFCGVFEGLLLLLCWRLSDSFSHSSPVCNSLTVSLNSHNVLLALSGPLLVQVPPDVSSCLQIPESAPRVQRPVHFIRPPAGVKRGEESEEGGKGSCLHLVHLWKWARVQDFIGAFGGLKQGAKRAVNSYGERAPIRPPK